MADFFNIVFAGEISPGADPATVRANIARLFKASDAMVEKLFSGQRIAVKKAVDQATAMKYRAVMKQAGAIAHIEPADEQGRTLAAPAPVTPKAETMAERIARLAAEQEKATVQRAAAAAPPAPAAVSAGPNTAAADGNWGIAPVGVMLGENRPAVAAVVPDTGKLSVASLGTDLVKPDERAQLAPPPVAVPDVSAIKMAPRGSDLIKAEEKAAEIPVAVDISAMSMAPPNTEVLKPEEKRVVVPVVVDVSGMSMAPPGTDLEQIREEKTPVNPDISKLKLA